MRQFLLVFFGMLLLTGQVLAQASKAGPTAAEEYQRRIRQERINNHYIPHDLSDAMTTLDGLIGVSSQNSYAQHTEDEVVKKLWFSFGRWLGVNWSLYDGSRFSVYLKDMGIDRPDGQIEFIMRLYHRHLRDAPLEVKSLASEYKAEKAQLDSLKLARATVIDSFKRQEAPPASDSKAGG